MIVKPDELSEKTWPSYLPKFAAEDFKAIGVIAVNYGELESMLKNVFSAATGMAPEHLSALFYRIPNNIRQDALIQLLNLTELTDELKDHTRYFLKCFKVCAENRHAIMHSSIGGEYRDAQRGEHGLILSKYSKAGNKLICSARNADLRKVADEIDEVLCFANGVAIYIRMFFDYRSKGKTDEYRRLLLPKRPPEPTPLRWNVHTSGQDNPPPPQPSKE